MVSQLSQLHPSSPQLEVVGTTDTSLDLWGKTCNDLQTDVAISDGVVSGTLKHIADYTSAGFDMSQGTNFLALSVIPSAEDSVITCDFNSKTNTLDSDNTIVLQMTDAKKSLSVVFTEKVDGETVDTVTVALTGLTLATE